MAKSNSIMNIRDKNISSKLNKLIFDITFYKKKAKNNNLKLKITIIIMCEVFEKDYFPSPAGMF